MGRALAWIFAPVLAHRRALLAVNLIYFGALLLGLAYVAVDPQAQRALLQEVGVAFSPTGDFGALVQAYRGGQLAMAIVLTFVVNLILGSALVLSLPSLIVPFAGLLVGPLRALLWGILFSPLGGMVDLRLLPHALTILLEGEAYVVAMLGVWLWWWPVLTKPGGRWQAWRAGLFLQGRIYVAVAFLLAVAATYEALEVIYLIPGA